MRGFLIGIGVALLIAGCTARSEPGGEAPVSGVSLKIGLSPETNIFRQLDRFQPLADYLAKKTGVPIRLRILPRYGNIIRNFEKGQLDGAFFGSFTYVLAHRHLHLDVLARPEQADGTSTYHGLLLVRKDSGIRGPEAMRGKVFAFVDRATTAGYLFPMAYFREHGIRDCRTYFRDTYFTGTHGDVIRDLLSGKADVGAVKNTIFERMEARDGRLQTALLVLARSPDVPENGLAVRSSLEPSIKEKLKRALLTMDRDPDGLRALESVGAARFIETTDRDYEPVIRYAGELGLDLETYDYDSDG